KLLCNKIDFAEMENANALFAACLSGNFECVKELTKYGASPNCVNSLTKCTPFYIACYKGYYEIVEYLIKSGKVNLYNFIDETNSFLHAAINEKHYDIVKLLIQNLDLSAYWKINCLSPNIEITDENITIKMSHK